MTIWFASGNQHKKAELEALLAGHTLKIPAEEGLGFDPDESGESFAENALIKARELYRLVSGLGSGPVIADDSGLCVDALGGRPGIRSARYGNTDGARLESGERNRLLLQELGDNPRRGARFVCAMVLLFNEDRFFIAQETLEGELIREERGKGGFGYDPILYLPQEGRTVAELGEDEKNRISHRGKAARIIAGILAGLS
ncbi:MAG: RdgB/HAM1 family non-canonical purine NTP pyrophosphatase [Treponema sp.]|jgi:XTP/dITP diphosphohydrolase|nr:RdgB/HAM1 family non-canonical purine NTP pyrophosphatase [Treponema sp.]